MFTLVMIAGFAVIVYFGPLALILLVSIWEEVKPFSISPAFKEWMTLESFHPEAKIMDFWLKCACPVHVQCC